MVRDQPDPPILLKTGAEKHVSRFVVIQRGISSAGRAPALQAGGRRFDPVILHHHLSNVAGICKDSAECSFKTKAALQEIAKAVFVLIDIDRLTSVERRTAVL